MSAKKRLVQCSIRKPNGDVEIVYLEKASCIKEGESIVVGEDTVTINSVAAGIIDGVGNLPKGEDGKKVKETAYVNPNAPEEEATEE